MIGILKRNGLDTKDWKLVYKMPYNAHLKKYKKIGHIEPGDKVMLPRMSSKDFEQINDAINWVAGTAERLLDTGGALSTAYRRLKRTRDITEKQYDRAQKELVTLEKQLEKAAKDCRAVDKMTGKRKELGKMAQCHAEAARRVTSGKNLKDLRKMLREKLTKKLDASKEFRALEDKLTAMDDLLAKTDKAIIEAHRYFSKLEDQMYGPRAIKPLP